MVGGEIIAIGDSLKDEDARAIATELFRKF
jgi:hypothetical protein